MIICINIQTHPASADIIIALRLDCCHNRYSDIMCVRWLIKLLHTQRPCLINFNRLHTTEVLPHPVLNCLSRLPEHSIAELESISRSCWLNLTEQASHHLFRHKRGAGRWSSHSYAQVTSPGLCAGSPKLLSWPPCVEVVVYCYQVQRWEWSCNCPEVTE